MYHSITFGNKNTWDDWHLVPTPNSPRPVVKTPTQKTNYIDIPGANGALDFSESLTGYPLYNNREDSFEFYVMNGYQDWIVLYNELTEHLHGKRMKMFLEDEPEYYYIGRFSVEWKSTTPRSTVTIRYVLDPFKWYVTDSTEEWLWDPFNFTNGIIRAALVKDIEVNSMDSYQDVIIDSKLLGSAPVTPVLEIYDADSNGIMVKYVNEDMSIDVNYPTAFDNGFHELYECIMNGTRVRFSFKGKGKVSIKFKIGRL